MTYFVLESVSLQRKSAQFVNVYFAACVTNVMLMEGNWIVNEKANDRLLLRQPHHHLLTALWRIQMVAQTVKSEITWCKTVCPFWYTIHALDKAMNKAREHPAQVTFKFRTKWK